MMDKPEMKTTVTATAGYVRVVDPTEQKVKELESRFNKLEDRFNKLEVTLSNFFTQLNKSLGGKK